MRTLIALVLLSLISACASVPMASSDLDAAGKQFAPPPPGKASLYVYRESIFGAAVSVSVTMGQRALGALVSDTWFQLDVDPGQYDIRCTGGEGADSKIVAIASGETRYVEVAIRMGVIQPRCAVFEVMPEQGRKAVLGGKRAAVIQ